MKETCESVELAPALLKIDYYIQHTIKEPSTQYE